MDVPTLATRVVDTLAREKTRMQGRVSAKRKAIARATLHRVVADRLRRSAAGADAFARFEAEWTDPEAQRATTEVLAAEAARDPQYALELLNRWKAATSSPGLGWIVAVVVVGLPMLCCCGFVVLRPSESANLVKEIGNGIIDWVNGVLS
ncbi:MAG: hypothetical protein HOU81_01410 [Hamadaea sp.]|uniref:hypothetical protein n=1 Tax=Hamadaea sp. TaxID=2024425 RepID=UPI0017938D7B|nr:hypothetical protein [Hamadaea sp.]NUR69456.1 hypothetical protein [Hamadaea sp.]NUT23381.1 hypothetical protein [Hamadaea sp.]